MMAICRELVQLLGSRLLQTSLCIVSMWLILAVSSTGGAAKKRTVVVMDDYGDSFGLMCHHCYRSIHGEDCVTMANRSVIDSQLCEDGERYCMVHWLVTDEKLTTFERRCAEECQSGCETVGDVYKLERCNECCQDDLCNIHSSSAKQSTLSALWSTVAITLSTAMMTLSYSYA